MAAVMGLDEPSIMKVCDEASAAGVVVPANFNSKIQVAVSGSHAGVEKAVEVAKASGAKRAVMLEVGGAFHSPLMDSARGGLAEYLDGVELAGPTRPVVANVSARPEDDPARLKELLVEQVTSPVRWSQTMEHLVSDGVAAIYEIGPGKVLTGLAKRDMRPETSVNLDTLADIEAFTAVKA
jgi:[acyl-carrier-protein] S-malonyltransferase